MTLAICGSLLMSPNHDGPLTITGSEKSHFCFKRDKTCQKRKETKTKSYSSLNNPKLKIYPDALKRKCMWWQGE